MFLVFPETLTPDIVSVRVLFLQRIFSGFPDGIRGIALLWLRIAVALLLLRDCAMNWERGHALVIPAAYAVAGLCLIAGVLTPTLGLIAAILEILKAVGPGWASWPFSLLMISVLVALAVLGPGAYSVDAWLFGRKKLMIGRPPR